MSFRIRDHGSTRSPSQGSTGRRRRQRGGGDAREAGRQAARDGAEQVLPRFPASPLPRSDVAQHVVLGDPTCEAGAGYRADVHVVLGGHAANHRGRFPPQPLLGGLRRPVAPGGICHGPSLRAGSRGNSPWRRRRWLSAAVAALGRSRWRRSDRSGRSPGGSRGLGGCRCVGCGCCRRAGALGCGRFGRRTGGGIGFDPGHHGLDRDRLTLLHQNLRQHPRVGSRDLGIDLVGRDLEDRLVPLDRVSHLLDPARQRPFGNRLAHLGHDYVYLGHRDLLDESPVVESPVVSHQPRLRSDDSAGDS